MIVRQGAQNDREKNCNPGFKAGVAQAPPPNKTTVAELSVRYAIQQNVIKNGRFNSKSRQQACCWFLKTQEFARVPELREFNAQLSSQSRI